MTALVHPQSVIVTKKILNNIRVWSQTADSLFICFFNAKWCCKYQKIFSSLIVWLFFSLFCLCFSWIHFPFFSWHGSNHSSGLFSTSVTIACVWMNQTLPSTWTLSWPIMWLCLLFDCLVCVPVWTPLPLSKHYLCLFFLLCGKQMKNLGRKAASASLLKRTIFARGECCSSCAAERARKRVDGTLTPGEKGVRGGVWGTRGAPRPLKASAHAFTVT